MVNYPKNWSHPVLFRVPINNYQYYYTLPVGEVHPFISSTTIKSYEPQQRPRTPQHTGDMKIKYTGTLCSRHSRLVKGGRH